QSHDTRVPWRLPAGHRGQRPSRPSSSPSPHLTTPASRVKTPAIPHGLEHDPGLDRVRSPAEAHARQFLGLRSTRAAAAPETPVNHRLSSWYPARRCHSLTVTSRARRPQRAVEKEPVRVNRVRKPGRSLLIAIATLAAMAAIASPAAARQSA